MDGWEAGPDRGPRVGSRVVVRHRLEAPDPGTGATMTDVVGDLVASDADALLVRTRRGEVRVLRALVTALTEVPPAPSRRGAPHRALSVESLQRVMVGAWPAVETARLGDWVLRASGGFTQRANSVVTVGSPGMPLTAALDAVEAWYAARGLPPNVAVAVPLGAEVHDEPVAAQALARGWTPRVPTLTLTAPTRRVARGTRDVEVGGDLTADWFEAFRSYRDVGDEASARAVLTGSPAQVFGTARDEQGRVVGIGRLGLAAGWGGVAAMWVAPTARRQGVASAVLAALAGAAARAGAASLHLQTDADNVGALRLYEDRGFERHHAYVNLGRPPG